MKLSRRKKSPKYFGLILVSSFALGLAGLVGLVELSKTVPRASIEPQKTNITVLVSTPLCFERSSLKRAIKHLDTNNSVGYLALIANGKCITIEPNTRARVIGGLNNLLVRTDTGYKGYISKYSTNY